MLKFGICLGLVIASVFISVATLGQTAAGICGKWKSEDKSKPLAVDVEARPDGTFVGKVVDDNVELDATISIVSSDRLKMVVRKMFVSKSLYLSRVK
jgi:hypothetical protein